MQHFARELFLLARQCGAAGLAEEARTLFDLSRQASGPDRRRRGSISSFMGRALAWWDGEQWGGWPAVLIGSGHEHEMRSVRCDERLQWRFEPYSFDEQHFVAGRSVA